MSLRILSGDLHFLKLQTRMPFKYGIATMTRVPQVFVRLQIEVNGRAASGVSADLLPPKWFTKDPAKPLSAEILEMTRVIEHATQSAIDLRGETAFELWQQIYRLQSERAKAEEWPPLLAHFGTSLVERALLEAMGRACQEPFHRLLRNDGLGLRLDEIHSDLQGRRAQELLPAVPLESIIARHTVGLADPLKENDISASERLRDGLPQSLEACARRYGLRHFKIKINGDLDRDLDRLGRVALVLEEHAAPDHRFTLDGNEQFKSIQQFRGYWEAISSNPVVRPFLERLLFVEQPLHRDVALEAKLAGFLQDWPDRPPLIIDESDGELESLPTALHLGYAGTSHKNCKGIFKGIANRALLADRQREQPSGRFIMSGEDLCNIGPVALLQDLAVMAALRIESVERNGHHYCAGLSMFPESVQRRTLEAHPDLYLASEQGWPALRIQQGRISVRSVNAAPFGVGFDLDPEQFVPLGQFRANSEGF